MLDEKVRSALDSALLRWADTERAWAAIEWTLAHDALVGVPLSESGTVRALLYNGARSIKQPDIDVIYTTYPHEIVVNDAVFKDAKAPLAGHG